VTVCLPPPPRIGSSGRAPAVLTAVGGGQVLATDGVWDNVYEEDMTRIVQVRAPHARTHARRTETHTVALTLALLLPRHVHAVCM
jgi:hypothetical protein